MDFFDDYGGEEFALALGLGDEIAEEKRIRRDLLYDEEPLVSEDYDPAWNEKD